MIITGIRSSFFRSFFIVMHMFIRVSVAFIEGKTIKKIRTNDLQNCARNCLHIKNCKSFNFDKLKEKCDLFSISAETYTLISGTCPYKDYYQRIGK